MSTNTGLQFVTGCFLMSSSGNIISPSPEKLLLPFLSNSSKIRHKKAEEISVCIAFWRTLGPLVSLRCLDLFPLGFHFISAIHKVPRCLRACGLRQSVSQGTEESSQSSAPSSKTCQLPFQLHVLTSLTKQSVCHLIVWSPSSFHIPSGKKRRREDT